MSLCAPKKKTVQAATLLLLCQYISGQTKATESMTGTVQTLETHTLTHSSFTLYLECTDSNES